MRPAEILVEQFLRMPRRNSVSGRRVFFWPRIVVRATFANGNTCKTETHLRPDLADRPDYVAAKRRLAILRGRVRSDRAAAESGTYVSCLEVTTIPAGVKA